MKRKPVHRITFLFVALLMFFSSTGFSMNVHYCGDKAVDYSIITDVASCGMETAKTLNKSCDNETTIQRKSCCRNESYQLELDTDLKNNVQLVEKVDLFTAVLVVQIIEPKFFFTVLEKNIDDVLYIPPKIPKDILVFNQVFRL